MPLWTGALSLYKLAFRHAAEVKVQALTCESDVVSLAITNSGGRAGILGNSRVSLEVNNEVVNRPTVLQAEKEHPVVKPQESFVLKMVPRIDGIASKIPSPPSSASCRYRIATQVREFDGASHDVTASCPCPAALP